MTESLHVVDQALCKGDGICSEVCPKDVLEMHEKKARTAAGRESHCIHCGQCVAVCPNEALQMAEVCGATFPERGKWSFGFEELMACLDDRRSVRLFRNKPVDRTLVEKVVEAAAAAPPGFPPTSTEILVLDTTDELAHLAAELRKGYGKLSDMWDNPIARTVIWVKRGAETFHALKSHVMGIVREDNAAFERNGSDKYLYNAPVLLLFHADSRTAAYHECAMIAATYAMIGAHVLGLGATMLSIVPPLINNMGAELRPRYGIPEHNKVVVGLILGHPKYKYRRAIRRPLKGVRFLKGEPPRG